MITHIQGSNICMLVLCFVCFVVFVSFANVRVLFSPYNIYTVFPVLLLPPNLKKYENEMPPNPQCFTPYTHRLRLLEGNLYHQFSKHSPSCINKMMLLEISVDPSFLQVWAKVANCLYYRRGALCPSFSEEIGVWSKSR